jgi:DHA1 family tetracycline resistance protein-like MFS transporter
MKSTRPAGMLFIFITLLVDVIGLGIIIPVLPNLIQNLTGTDASGAAVWGGWLVGLYALMQFFFAPIMGALSDAHGRRPIILLSLLGLGLDYLLMAFAPNMIWLFLGRAVSGIMGASFSVAQAYIADISAPEKRAQNFGMMGAAFGLGFILGPVIGGILGNLEPHYPFIAAAILSLLNLAYGFFILPESHPKENRRPFELKRANPFSSLKNLSKYSGLIGLFIAFFFLYLAGFSVQSTWSFFGKFAFQWNADDIGYSLGAVGVLVSLVQGGLIRYTSKKLGDKKSILIGMIFSTLGLFLFSFATSGWMMYLFLVPYCLGGLATPALQSIISKQVPLNEQGEMQGTLSSLISITSFIGPLVMTSLFSVFSSSSAPFKFPGAAFFAGGMCCIIALFIAMRTLKNKSL